MNAVEKDPLREAQLRMVHMLKTIHTICEEHNIAYWLTDGTLLGSVRHKGFIPWDDDADIAMLREDYDKFARIVVQQLPEPYKIETTDLNTHGKHNWLKIMYLDDFEWIDEEGHHHKGISIDIFPFDYVHENSKFQKIVHRFAHLNYPAKVTGVKDILYRLINRLQIQKIHSKINKKSNIVTYGVETPFFGWAYFEIDNIFPLKKGIFEGQWFLTPKNADNYLTLLYGNYMKLPDVADRQIHMSSLQFSEKN